MMKTAELTGAALDWAVSACIGIGWEMGDIDANEYGPGFKPSTDWAFGGPIIERERITIEWEGDPDPWCACIMADQEMYGPTALIAAMRCFVFSKLGNEVEIPEGLT